MTHCRATALHRAHLRNASIRRGPTRNTTLTPNRSVTDKTAIIEQLVRSLARAPQILTLCVWAKYEYARKNRQTGSKNQQQQQPQIRPFLFHPFSFLVNVFWLKHQCNNQAIFARHKILHLYRYSIPQSLSHNRPNLRPRNSSFSGFLNYRT